MRSLFESRRRDSSGSGGRVVDPSPRSFVVSFPTSTFIFVRNQKSFFFLLKNYFVLYVYKCFYFRSRHKPLVPCVFFVKRLYGPEASKRGPKYNLTSRNPGTKEEESNLSLNHGPPKKLQDFAHRKGNRVNGVLSTVEEVQSREEDLALPLGSVRLQIPGRGTILPEREDGEVSVTPTVTT